MKTTDAFWDKHAEGYAKRPIKDMPAYEQTLAHVRRHLTSTDKVVELGCGTGSTALLLADSVANMTGTDISEKMIEIANGKVADHPTDNVQFTRSDASCSALPTAGYDAVLAFNLMHLLRDIPATARSARRLLKPGGLFISKTPCLAKANRFLPALIWVMRKVGYAPYVGILSVQDLERDIASAGFEIVETAFYPAKSGSRFIVARRLEDH